MASSSHSRNIDVRAARTLRDFLFLRRLRNRVRHEMTNSTDPIGYLRQLRFYLGRPPNVSIYIARMDAEPAGYLLLRQEARTCFITEAVDAPFRRRGVAANMIRFAQDCRTHLTAEILVGNAASIKLHQAAGFAFAGDDGRIATYLYSGT
jgi:hypothetical protein